MQGQFDQARAYLNQAIAYSWTPQQKLGYMRQLIGTYVLEGGSADALAKQFDAAIAEGSSVGVLLNSTGMCNVPAVKGLTLAAAKRALTGGSCRLGRVTRAYSKLARGHVSSQKPAAGSVRPARAKVDLVVSLGRKR